MSRRPGIGTNVLPALLNTLNGPEGFFILDKRFDVPHDLRHGDKRLPLGQFLTRKLRKEFFGDEKTPDKAKQLRTLRHIQEVALSPSARPGTPEFNAIQKARSCALKSRFHAHHVGGRVL